MALIRVLLAEDQAMVRGALAALLDRETDIEVVAEVARVKADVIASRSRIGSPDKKRPKNTSSETPTSERQLRVRRWAYELVELNGLHGQSVALSCDSSVH